MNARATDAAKIWRFPKRCTMLFESKGRRGVFAGKRKCNVGGRMFRQLYVFSISGPVSAMSTRSVLRDSSRPGAFQPTRSLLQAMTHSYAKLMAGTAVILLR